MTTQSYQYIIIYYYPPSMNNAANPYQVQAVDTASQ